ncbi:hypothetical protein SUBVAR_06925 [Subdoligranulum variabile DSM 15176]|uniref:Uncharacterized protein n=1 Tax=Subdoligranulum variabile DSM 15176 TaxID=411471 RepID=D1PR96_9FIRM|nr:hypothetical protein SUBVAR_06925 [Subdoligranulum variabile DSM 15176]
MYKYELIPEKRSRGMLPLLDKRAIPWYTLPIHRTTQKKDERWGPVLRPPGKA